MLAPRALPSPPHRAQNARRGPRSGRRAPDPATESADTGHGKTIRSYRVLVLALDTTTRAGSVAVTDDDRVLALVEGDGARTHGERLPGELQAALTAAAVDVRRLDLIVAASGPGAFTGLRIGLAAVQGLAMVIATPVVG